MLVVLAATVVTAGFELEDHSVSTIGDVPAGLPLLALPGIPAHLWPGVLAAAAGICIVVFADNILTARAFAARHGERIDANQELSRPVAVPTPRPAPWAASRCRRLGVVRRSRTLPGVAPS